MLTERSDQRIPTAAVPVAPWKRMLQLGSSKALKALSSQPVVPYALALLIAVGAKLPTLNNSIIFIDEPAYLVEAARLDTPLKFMYSARYVTETKFQLSLVPYLAALWINQSQAILWLHIFGLVAVVASTMLLVALSYSAFRTYVPGILAALLWGILLTRDPLTIAPLLEYFQAPLLLAALWVFVRWANAHSAPRLLQRRSLLSLAGAGVLVGAAALVKPPGILVAPVLAVGVFLAARDGATLRARFCAAAMPLAGATAAVALFVLPYLVQPDALGALLFNMVGLSTRYASHESSLMSRLFAMLNLFDVAGIILVVIALGAHALIYGLYGMRWSERERRENLIRLVLLGSGLALLVGYLTGQAKDSYVVAILPPLALYGWSIITYASTSITRPLGRVAFLAAVAVLIVTGLPASYPGHYVSMYSPAFSHGSVYASGLRGVDARALAAAIDARTRPGDGIWVYYNAPEIYWMANRKPVTDEPVGTWLVDYYDQFWFQRTLQQIEQERPALIVGFDSPRYARRRAATLLDLPLIGAYIQSHYTCTLASQAEVGGSATVEFCTLRPSAELRNPSPLANRPPTPLRVQRASPTLAR